MKTYITLVKNGERKTFEKVNDKVLCTMEVAGALVSNPTLGALYADGWQEYIQPTPEPPSPEELLQIAKDGKIAEIDAYDNSEAVNQFYLGNSAMWLDKTRRVSLSYTVAAMEAAGEETITIWNGTEKFTLPVATVKAMLGKLETYASECYNQTAQHKANVEALTTVEDVASYGYTTDYPEKISFQYE